MPESFRLTQLYALMEAAVTFSQHPFRFIESLDAVQAETVVQFCRVRREIEVREKLALAGGGPRR